MEHLVVLGVPAVCPQIIPVIDRVAGPAVGEVLIGLEVALQLGVQGLQELPRFRGCCLGAVDGVDVPDDLGLARPIRNALNGRFGGTS